MVLVGDEALREAIRLLLRLTHNLAEGAGAASTAAAVQLRERLAGKTVVGVLSGGNLDVRELARILQGEGGQRAITPASKDAPQA
jgi:threonine dehydratase